MPKTDAERQAERRKRMKKEGREEVRNIFLPKILHPELKAYAQRLLGAHRKEQK